MKRRSRKNAELVGNRSAVATDYDDVLAGGAHCTLLLALDDPPADLPVGGGHDGVHAYGEGLIQCLSIDLSSRFGRGFSMTNLKQFKKFYLVFRKLEIGQTPSDLLGLPQIGQTPTGLLTHSSSPSIDSTQSDTLSATAEISQTLSGESVPSLNATARRFPLPWSHYVRLLKVEKPEARRFYETEALRGGWSVRQLDRQISTLFYERTLASRNKGAMLKKGAAPRAGELLTPEEEIKDSLVLEFLGLKDEYSETDLEEALIRQLESFLLELGGDFTFVGRQKRLRVEDEWYRVDLVFFHRTLRCLVVIDLKVGRFTHADVGQMLLYLGYAAEHWTRPGENPPVGLILCAQHNHSVARYTLDRLPDKVLAAEYRMALPDEATLAAELERTQAALERRSLRPNVVVRGRKRGRK
jgi:predicted nuclease of restriction endonuclease-like (RecB) superfamily